jgi:hypothetical protein
MTALPSLDVFLFGFPDNRIFTGWDSTPSPTPQPGGPGLRIYDLLEVQLYPESLGTHFSRLLRNAFRSLGLFVSSGRHTEAGQAIMPYDKGQYRGVCVRKPESDESCRFAKDQDFISQFAYCQGYSFSWLRKPEAGLYNCHIKHEDL